ncbi:MAG: hypothetical protein R2839_04665 [Thermomicrobiales bacterium]
MSITGTEEGYIASYASPSSVSTPWEVLAAMDDVVFTKRQGAYSDTAAARFSVPWISLVTESDARLVLRAIQQAKREKKIPAGVFDIGGASIVTAEEAEARYEACDAWFDATNLLVIANGPYQLTDYDPPAQFAQLDAFRPEGYPFTAEDFRYGTPPTLTIDPVTAPTTLWARISPFLSLSLTGRSLRPVHLRRSCRRTAPHRHRRGRWSWRIQRRDRPGDQFDPLPGLYQLFLIAASSDIAQVAQQRIDLGRRSEGRHRFQAHLEGGTLVPGLGIDLHSDIREPVAWQVF